MDKLNPGHEPNTPPPPTIFQPRLLPLLQKLKSAYLSWFSYYQTLPKTTRYSLGQRIDTLFIETIESVTTASFLPKEEKRPYVSLAIRKLDTAKILLMVLWETKALPTKQYAALSAPLDEIGKMLGGWQGQLTKTHPTTRPDEK
ncbi:MAG: hypothetical protein UW06_C0009G0015 [Parcubacteria group bacterium GW2011_GWE1_43_8]|nr:MAG: hypothetical protein UW06_C0009G0015 [Parcubacteria group bacterium GW2011_GWE1_43_8]